MSLPLRKAAYRFDTRAGLIFLSLALLGMATSWLQQAVGGSDNKPGGQARPTAQALPAKPPPLELDEDEPLRLDSVAKPVSPSSKKGADNGACFVCHANLKKESLAATHATNGVGCASCHGPSTAHRNDEANIIPPDIMFATETIDASCARCHDGHDVEPRGSSGASWRSRRN